MIKVWDPLLRLFHWSLVAIIALAWLTSEAGDTLHEWAGYIALGLIAFRLVWGLIGPRYARFSRFIPGPQEVIGYTRDMLNKREKRYIGHNPLGALMVVALLATTAATGVTGWLIAAPARLATGLSVVQGIHEALASMLLTLIFIHVVGVIYASRRHKENLAHAMVTGQKPAARPNDTT